MTRPLEHWNPEDPGFWARSGAQVASRNLWLSATALALAFAVWMMWSVVVAWLPQVGFRYSTNQLFWLAALPALAGATLRFAYAFVVPLVGGRLFTVLSTASLLLPALGAGLAVQDLNTPYEWMVVLALLCGLGGANFASSMANLKAFYPRARVATALGLNAGLGNAGVAVAQALVPLVIGLGLFGSLAGAPQTDVHGAPLWLQNAGFVWVPLILLCTAAVGWGMNDLAPVQGGFAEQAVIFKRRHTWLMCLLYVGSFGSFIGFAAALPLLASSQFPRHELLHVLWLGPLLGVLARPLGGWLSDRLGGARITLWSFAALLLGAALVLVALPGGRGGGRLELFLGAFVLLFVAAGVGNGSSLKMIPTIFALQPKEAAAALGFVSAVGAYGGFFIPKALGTAIAWSGDTRAAWWVFIAFYLSCMALTWWQYSRRHASMPC